MNQKVYRNKVYRRSNYIIIVIHIRSESCFLFFLVPVFIRRSDFSKDFPLYVLFPLKYFHVVKGLNERLLYFFIDTLKTLSSCFAHHFFLSVFESILSELSFWPFQYHQSAFVLRLMIIILWLLFLIHNS